MVFSNSFRVHVVARVVLLAALIFVLWWSVLRTTWDATPVICATLLVLSVAELVRYVESGTRDLRNLLRAVAGGDFTSALPRRRRGASFAEYEEASRTLIQAYQRLDLRRAASDDLLRDVVEHVGAAVLCFSDQGRIAFANAAARELLGSPGAGVASLAATDPRLPAQLMGLQNDERAQIELQLAGERSLLLLHARRFTLLDERFTVVFCHDIRDELETRDVEAWQTLTRVLMHEMMNSLTPIMTLSGLLRDTLGAQPTGTIVARSEDVAESIEVIHERSSGLARFIQAYRQFSNPPAPLRADIPLALLLERVARLKKPELDQSGIRLDVMADPAAVMHGDAQQIEQVLINLLRNAQDALAGQADARIELRCSRESQGRVLVHVTDNGPGIAPAIIDKVFVPFFTTRTGGTGIGLALSRQIVQLNGGKISVESQPGHCRFTLRLPGRE